MIDLHKGDFLTFAAIADALDVEVSDAWDWRDCEITPGIYIRHPELQDSDSRSDISRDGYLGVLFNLASRRAGVFDIAKVEEIRSAGWPRGWTMGKRGNFDYLNIWPLVPLLYAFRWRWFPTIPTLCTPWNNTGFRAHLLALTICIERALGKKRNCHRDAAWALYNKNQDNRWFRALHYAIIKRHDVYTQYPTDTYDWGGCPPELHDALIGWTLRNA